MAKARSGYIQQLPSGAFRVSVYAGTDPLTGRQIRLRRTCKTERAAEIELGKLLEQAADGRRADSRVTVADALARYMTVAELEPSTRETYGGYIRRTILPALGSMELRKVRGPILDTFYARLRRCGNLACTGRPFIEHRAFPGVVIEPGGSRSAWRQAAAAIRDAVASGQMVPGQQLPSARELAARHGLPGAALRRALEELAAEGVIVARQGRCAVVAAGPGLVPVPRPQAEDTRHDCSRAGCQPHRCRPMSGRTIRQIHAILSGAFAAAVRWEWIDRNPAGSAKLPKAPHRSPTSPTPGTVAAVIAAASDQELDLLAAYVWLAAVTGARRGELCGLQWADVDLDAGLVHIAFSYLVRAGQKLRKDTKTHQERTLAIDAVTVAVLAERKQYVQALLADVGVMLAPAAYVFASDPAGRTPWNPDWVSHKVAEVASGAGVTLSVKSLRHYTASQLLAGGIDLRNTAARLGHGGGGATTLRHYADPVSEVDRRAAAYLAQLTTGNDKSTAAGPIRNRPALRRSGPTVDLLLTITTVPRSARTSSTDDTGNRTGSTGSTGSTGIPAAPYHDPFHARRRTSFRERHAGHRSMDVIERAAGTPGQRCPAEAAGYGPPSRPRASEEANDTGSFTPSPMLLTELQVNRAFLARGFAVGQERFQDCDAGLGFGDVNLQLGHDPPDLVITTAHDGSSPGWSSPSRGREPAGRLGR